MNTVVVDNCCCDCSIFLKSTYKRCYACNYKKKHGHDVPENTCPCGVSCKTFKSCYTCHVKDIEDSNVVKTHDVI